jgi:polysaccharide biosynthesis transport protein
MAEKKEDLTLTVSNQLGPARVMPERLPVYLNAPAGPEDSGVQLSHYLWILRRYRWRMLSFVAVALLATVVISSRLTPIYEATATIDIDREAPMNAVGQESSGGYNSYDLDQFLATQTRLIQSDSVLRPVAQRFKLLEPSPVSGALPTARAQESPISLQNLKVTRPPNTSLLLISYRSSDPQLAANVANSIADSYIQNTWDIRFQASSNLSSYMEKQLEQLKAKMESSSERLAQFEKDLNVIDPEQKTNVLSSRLLQLNTDLTNAQTELVHKEVAYNAVRGGSLEAAQASPQGEQLRRLADTVREAEQKFTAVKAQYGANHPEYRKAASLLTALHGQFDALKTDIIQRVSVEYQQSLSRQAMLKKAVDETKAEFDKLNARSFEYKSVKQEADSDKGLYQELWRKIKEAGINSSFQSSSIRRVDSARPALQPVLPNIPLNVALAFLLSTLIAMGAALLTDTLDSTVRDPEQIQREMRTEVVGSLPVVKPWRGRFLTPGQTGQTLSVGDSLQAGQVSAYEEAVRTLRDSILLSDLGRRPRSLLVTSATPREGKTTTTLNLAIVHSLQKRKTLLIDADLRRPSIHERLGLSNERGFSTYLNGGGDWREMLQTANVSPDLDVLAAGPASRRAADRIGGVLEAMLIDAERDYDLVLVDSPPLLGFAEPLQIAAVVDAVVVVTLAGQTNRNALSSVLNSLRRLKANVIGVALNEVRQDMSDRYYYYGYYGKSYSKYYKHTPEPASGEE